MKSTLLDNSVNINFYRAILAFKSSKITVPTPVKSKPPPHLSFRGENKTFILLQYSKIFDFSSRVSRPSSPADDDNDDVWYCIHWHGFDSNGLPIPCCAWWKSTSACQNVTYSRIDSRTEEGKHPILVSF